jgi:hypothetical protein
MTKGMNGTSWDKGAYRQRVVRDKRSKDRQTSSEKQTKGEEAKRLREQQQKHVESLAAKRVARGQTDAYISYAREVINSAVDGNVENSQVCHLLGMTPQSFGKHVKRAKNLGCRSKYNGPGAGRPVYQTRADKENFTFDMLNKKATRNCDEMKTKLTLITERVAKSLKERGYTPPKKGVTVAKTFALKLENETGVGIVKGGRDNERRTRGMGQPRNLISNYASMLALNDSKYTVDSKDTHPRLRLNIDAMQTYSQTVDGRVVTVCKKVPLIENSPALSEAWKKAKTQPATLAADDTLNHVTPPGFWRAPSNVASVLQPNDLFYMSHKFNTDVLYD